MQQLISNLRGTFSAPAGMLLAMSAVAGTSDEPGIPYTTAVLDNGLTVIVHEDRKAPIVAVNIWYHVGSKNEVAGRTGFAHLFEHLMFQGTENFDDEYLQTLQQLGATDLNATTWFDRTNYFQTVPKNALDTVLWLESDRMGHFIGAITQDKLDEQRGVVKNEKRQGENQPYGKVWEHVLRRVFPNGHPYAWETIGSMDDLDAASLEDIKTWFATYYGPNNAVLAIAGDVDAQETILKVEKYFGDIEPGPPLTKMDAWVPHHTEERRQVMQDRVPQARLYKVWAGPEWGTRDAHLLSLATSILSHGKNSRLFKRLVYTDQIATDASISAQSQEISGLTYLVATARPGVDLTEVEAAADEEITRFIEDGPTRKELERAKTQFEASFLRGIERIGGSYGKAGTLAKSQVYGGSPDLYKNRLENIRSATRQDVQRVAEKWLRDGPFVMEVHPYPELTATTTGADRTTLPDPGELPDIGFPDFERSRLENGLEIIIADRPGAPAVEMSLILDAGYASDQSGSWGTAKMAMAMLDEGTQKRTALEISDELAMLGAMLSAGSNLDKSFVDFSALRSRLDDSLKIFADVILNPAFPEDELERTRQRWLAQIAREKTQPLSMALRVLPGLLYGGDHPYGQPMTGSGTDESILAISRDDLINFHQTWFKANQATLVIVGDIDRDTLITQLERLFGGWEGGNVPTKDFTAKKPAQARVIYLVDRPDSPQSIIFAGQLLPPKANPDEIAIAAMNDILGGQSTARINMNLREDKAWAYGAYSVIVDAQGDRPLFVYAPVQADKTSEAITEIESELRNITEARPPEAGELQLVQQSNTLSLPGRWETAADILDAINEIVRFRLPDDYWSNYAEGVNRLSVDDVVRASATHIHPDETAWVVIGDRKQIEAGLRELDFDEIRMLDTDGNLLTGE